MRKLRGIASVDPSAMIHATWCDEFRRPRSRRLGTRCAAVGCSLLLGLVRGLSAQEPALAEETLEAYGNTPPSLVPYRALQEPYARFFQKATPFLGGGRDEPKEALTKVRIGLLRPVPPAPDADLGLETWEGVQLALEQANTAGGYEGVPFELVERADVGLWGAASNEMVAFKHEDRVSAVIGSVDAANTHIALRVALKTNMAIVNTASTDPTLTETNLPWMLRCTADDRQQGNALAQHIYSACGLERVVAFRVNDRFGRTGIAEFRDAARRLGHPLGVELRWEPGDRDFSDQLARIAETAPQAIVLWGNAADAAAVVRAIRGWIWSLAGPAAAPRVFGCDRLVSRNFLTQAGDAAEGVVAVAAYDPTSGDSRHDEFAKAFTVRFGHPPGSYAAHAYDGANILFAAVRRAGPNCVRIRDALYEIEHYDGVTGSIDFDATMNDVGPVYLATVEGGRFLYRSSRLSEAVPRGATRAAYRTLADSPPIARSPDRPPRNGRDAYRIGCFLPSDAEGMAALRGVQMAVADDDAARRPDTIPVELRVRSTQGAWGDDSNALVSLILDDEVLALIGSTERRGTHLAEMLAAKMHFPIVTLCAEDPTINQAPLPWVFRIASAAALPLASDFAARYRVQHGEAPSDHAVWGFEAGRLLLARIRAGAHSRRSLRDSLAADQWFDGLSGRFRFDGLGVRVDDASEGRDPVARSVTLEVP